MYVESAYLNIAYLNIAIGISEDSDATYFILDNVENEVVIQDTPNVRCEQITDGEVLVSLW